MRQRVTARLIYTIPIVVCFFAVVVGWSQPAAAANASVTNALSFSVRTEGMISGQTKSGVQFYSEKKDDGSFEVYIKLRLKMFSTAIAPDNLVRVEAWFVKRGIPAKLTRQDIVSLHLFYKQLKGSLDENIEVEDKLNRFVTLLINFYPSGEYFDNNPNMTLEYAVNIRSGDEFINSLNLCDQIGKSKSGKYTVNITYRRWFREVNGECYDDPSPVETSSELTCTETVIVGGEDCLGRCGPGCGALGFHDRYTQECLNHDLCVRATGEITGPCFDEFLAARASWMIGGGDVCSDFAGTWNFSFDWDGDEPLTTTILSLYNDKTFKTGDGHTGTWGVSFSIFMKLYFSNGTTYTGVFNSSKTSISGTMVDSAGIMGTWSATKNAYTASISDQKKSSIIPISISGHH